MESSILSVIIQKYYPATAENVQLLVQSNVLLEKLSAIVYKKAEDAVQKYADISARIIIVTRMLRAWRNEIYTDINKSSVFIAVAVLLYFVNPIDLLPDFIPIIGGLDDLLLLRYLLKVIDKEIDKFTSWEQQNTMAV